MIENYLITGLPINLGKMGVLYQPTIEDMLMKGITNKEIIQPFLVHIGLLIKDENSELFGILKNFDLFFLEKNNLLTSLKSSLSVLYRTDNIRTSDDKLLENKKIIIDDSFIIDRDNYDDLTDVVFKMFFAQRPTKSEEEKVNLPTEKHRKIWETMQNKKKKKALKEEMNLCDIINVVSHGSVFIPYEQIRRLTYYQLLNSYKTIMKIENYKEFTQFKLSPKFEIKSDMKHWVTDVKISNVPLVD